MEPSTQLKHVIRATTQSSTELQIYLSSVKIATTRGLEVARMSHGWAQEVSKNNMTVGPWNIGQGRESHASIGFATRTRRLPSTAPGSLW